MDLQMKEQMDEGTEKYWRVLTAHQQRVLCLLVAGKTYAEVAAFLGIRPRTVRYYVDAIIDKYHVHIALFEGRNGAVIVEKNKSTRADYILHRFDIKPGAVESME